MFDWKQLRGTPISSLPTGDTSYTEQGNNPAPGTAPLKSPPQADSYNELKHCYSSLAKASGSSTQQLAHCATKMSSQLAKTSAKLARLSEQLEVVEDANNSLLWIDFIAGKSADAPHPSGPKPVRNQLK